MGDQTPVNRIVERNTEIVRRFLDGEEPARIAADIGISACTARDILRGAVPAGTLAELRRNRRLRRSARGERSQQIYRFILEYKAVHQGASPSLREIGRSCGISSSSIAWYHLQRLAQAGRVQIESGPGQPLAILVPGARWVPPES